jgi:hypothetical protein
MERMGHIVVLTERAASEQYAVCDDYEMRTWTFDYAGPRVWGGRTRLTAGLDSE